MVNDKYAIYASIQHSYYAHQETKLGDGKLQAMKSENLI
jgi:hypothetical protein